MCVSVPIRGQRHFLAAPQAAQGPYSPPYFPLPVLVAPSHHDPTPSRLAPRQRRPAVWRCCPVVACSVRVCCSPTPNNPPSARPPPRNELHGRVLHAIVVSLPTSHPEHIRQPMLSLCSRTDCWRVPGRQDCSASAVLPVARGQCDCHVCAVVRTSIPVLAVSLAQLGAMSGSCAGTCLGTQAPGWPGPDLHALPTAAHYYGSKVAACSTHLKPPPPSTSGSTLGPRLQLQRTPVSLVIDPSTPILRLGSATSRPNAHDPLKVPFLFTHSQPGLSLRCCCCRCRPCYSLTDSPQSSPRAVPFHPIPSSRPVQHPPSAPTSGAYSTEPSPHPPSPITPLRCVACTV